MKRSVCASLLALAAISALPAGASTFLAVSEDELVAQAEAVVEGRVVEVHSFWNAERTAILTEAVLEVDDTVMGVAPSHVNLRTFGGRVGNYVVEAHGFPTFARGERLLVFLEPEQDGAHKVLGYLQGQFRIRTDDRGRTVAVSAMGTNERYLRPDGTAAPRPRALPLEQLKNQIHAAADRTGRPAVR